MMLESQQNQMIWMSLEYSSRNDGFRHLVFTLIVPSLFENNLYKDYSTHASDLLFDRRNAATPIFRTPHAEGASPLALAWKYRM